MFLSELQKCSLQKQTFPPDCIYFPGKRCPNSLSFPGMAVFVETKQELQWCNLSHMWMQNDDIYVNYWAFMVRGVPFMYQYYGDWFLIM